MDLLQVNSKVVLKVKNMVWSYRDNYAPGVVNDEYNVYAGTIMREKWFDSSEIGITTGNPEFPFRRINRSRIVEVNGATVSHTPIVQKSSEIVVKGSKGNNYIVTKHNGKASCTCPGFNFRRSCKHLELAV